MSIISQNHVLNSRMCAKSNNSAVKISFARNSKAALNFISGADGVHFKNKNVNNKKSFLTLFFTTVATVITFAIGFFKEIFSKPVSTAQNKEPEPAKDMSAAEDTLAATHAQKTPVGQEIVSEQSVQEAGNETLPVDQAEKSKKPAKIFPESAIENLGIEPIKTKEEYEATLEKLKDIGEFSKDNKKWQPHWISNWSDITGIEFWEEGILPYSAYNDISDTINSYLRTKEIKPKDMCWGTMNFSEAEVRDYIRVLDYALKHLDEKYGRYEGVVFRCGEINPDRPGYVSTSKKPDILSQFATNKRIRGPYNIIFTDCGHKIVDEQKRLSELPLPIEVICHQGSFAREEAEILLSPDVKYELIDENDVTPEMQEAAKALKDVFIRCEEGGEPYVSYWYDKPAFWRATRGA